MPCPSQGKVSEWLSQVFQVWTTKYCVELLEFLYNSREFGINSNSACQVMMIWIRLPALTRTKGLGTTGSANLSKSEGKTNMQHRFRESSSLAALSIGVTWMKFWSALTIMGGYLRSHPGSALTNTAERRRYGELFDIHYLPWSLWLWRDLECLYGVCVSVWDYVGPWRDGGWFKRGFTVYFAGLDGQQVVHEEHYDDNAP